MAYNNAITVHRYGLAIHFIEIAKTPTEIPTLLSQIYDEIKILFTKYQSIFAFIAALMFGDKLKAIRTNVKNAK